MNLKLHYLLLIITYVGMFGCKKQSIEEASTIDGNPAKMASVVNATVPENGNTYTVDVFYFLPKGTTVISDYQSRINNLTTFTKEWFTNQLASRSNLWANNLLDFTASNGNITVTIIQGKYAPASYNGQSGLAIADAEIDAYISANPYLKHSEHSLVYLPGTAPLKPVTGLNVSSCRTQNKRRIYEADYPGYDSNNQDNNFNIAYGSFLHELGHSFNLDHNRVPKTLSQARNGISLMSFKSPIFSSTLYISPTDAEILKTCQVFNKKSNIVYYKEPSPFNLLDFEAIDATIDHDGSISFDFDTESPVKYIVFYTDAASTGTSLFSDVSDYDAFTTLKKLDVPIRQGGIIQKFYLKDFYDLTADKKYRMKLNFVFENGSIVKKYLYFSTNGSETFGWANMNPTSMTPLDKSRWKVSAVSSESLPNPVNGPAKLLIDNDCSTVWIPSKLDANGRNYPSEVLIDCGKSVTAKTFILSQLRNSWGLKFQVQVSDDGINFRVAGDFESAHRQTLGYLVLPLPAKEYFQFTNPQTFRYFKVVTKRGHDFLMYKTGSFYRMLDPKYPAIYNAPAYISEVGLLN